MGRGRRSEILAVAAALFAERGIAGTSVRKIAEEVGILNGSLYHHFSSKNAMVEEIISTYLDELLTLYAQVANEDYSPRQAIEELLRVSLVTIERHPHATEIYQNDGAYLASLSSWSLIADSAATIRTTWLEIIERGVEEGAFRGDVPPRVFYNMLRDALWLSVRWFDPTSGHSREQLADDFLAVFLEGFTKSSASGVGRNT